MANNMLDNVKACIFPGDLLNPIVTITKDAVYTLQDFFYKIERRKDGQGIPYGPPMRSVIDFAVRTLPDGYLRRIYDSLQCKTEQTFSFATNVFFGEDEEKELVLLDYESAFVISGYVISVEENYNGALGVLGNNVAKADTHGEDLMFTRISLLIDSIVFVGSNKRGVSLFMN